MQNNNQQGTEFNQKTQQQGGQVFEIRAHQAKLQDNPQQGTQLIESQVYRAQLKEKQPTGQPEEKIKQDKDIHQPAQGQKNILPQEKIPSQEKKLTHEKKPLEQKPLEQKPLKQKPLEQKPLEHKPLEKKPQEHTVFRQKNIDEENPCVEKEVKVVYTEKPVPEEVCQPPLQRQEARRQEKLPEIKPQEKKIYAPQAPDKQPPAPAQKAPLAPPRSEISKLEQKPPSLEENRAHLKPLHESHLKEKDFHETPIQEKYHHEMPLGQEKQKQYQDNRQDQGSQQPQGTILFTQMYQAKLHPQGGNQSDQFGGMQLPGIGQQGFGQQGFSQQGFGQQGNDSMSASNTWTQPLPDAQGAIIGNQNYDREAAREDAMALLNAMKGAGTNKDTIVEISGNRTFAQRQMIVKEYAQIDQNEKRDLLQDLKSEVGGDLERLVLPLYMMPGEFDARLMEKAMYGIKNDVDLLVEVLCTRTNKEIEDMKNAWKEKIDSRQRLEERVDDETKKLVGLTNFHNLCLKLLEAKRPPCTKPDEKQVRADAEELNHQLLDRPNIDTAKAKFVEIFTERSWAHIGAVVGEFQGISQKWTMDAAIGHEFGDSSNTTKALRVMAEFCFQPYDFWAKRLREAMKGLGTDDSAVVRIIVSRSEVDMANIAKVFGHRYGDGRTLKSWIESDTSGAYRQLLLNLCGYY